MGVSYRSLARRASGRTDATELRTPTWAYATQVNAARYPLENVPTIGTFSSLMITRTSSLFVIAGLALIVAGLHLAAHQFFLYWTFWWYDIMMHGLGGLLIGLLAGWIIVFPWRGLPLSRPLFIIVLTLAIGVMWEIFEYVIGSPAYYSSFSSYALDTIFDILMDTAGALAAVLVFNSRYIHE